MKKLFWIIILILLSSFVVAKIEFPILNLVNPFTGQMQLAWWINSSKILYSNNGVLEVNKSNIGLSNLTGTDVISMVGNFSAWDNYSNSTNYWDGHDSISDFNLLNESSENLTDSDIVDMVGNYSGWDNYSNNTKYWYGYSSISGFNLLNESSENLTEADISTMGFTKDTDTNSYNTTDQIRLAAPTYNLSTENVEDIVGGMLDGTETHISVTYDDDGGANIDFVVSDDWWDADGDISANEISESKIGFSTACAAGAYYRLSGNDLECTVPAGGSADNASWNQTLASTLYQPIGENLFDQLGNTTSAVTYISVNTGQGANELYDMDQNVLVASDVTHNSMNLTAGINMTGNNITGTSCIVLNNGAVLGEPGCA